MGLCVGAKVYCERTKSIGYIIYTDGDREIPWRVLYKVVGEGFDTMWRPPEKLKFLGMVPQGEFIETARKVLTESQDYIRDTYGVEDLSTIREIRKKYRF